MRKFFIMITILTLGLFLSALSGSCFAQGENEPLQQDELSYSWGTISSLSSDTIVLTEYDYETEEEADVAYEIGANVEVNNIDSINNLKIGDEVEIAYVLTGDARIAEAVSLQKILEEDVAGEEIMDENVPDKGMLKIEDL